MVIDKNKDNNVLCLNVAPNGCINPTLLLTNSATFYEVDLNIIPINSNSRYISFELPQEELDCAMYNYQLFDGDRLVTRGILNVFDGIREGVITPDESDDDSNEYIYYNGE